MATTPRVDAFLATPAPAPAPGTPAGSPIADPATLAQAHDQQSAFSVVAEYSPALRVLLSAAIVSSVIGAQAAAGGTAGARHLAFINARLMPCLVKAGLDHQIQAITAALARGGHAAAALGGGAAGRFEGTGEVLGAHVERLWAQVADGFHDAIAGPPRGRNGNGSDGLSESRLLSLIGMVVGLVYLGFLTFWLRATRRRDAEGA